MINPIHFESKKIYLKIIEKNGLIRYIFTLGKNFFYMITLKIVSFVTFITSIH